MGKTFSFKNINAQVTVFNETKLIIFQPYLPNIFNTCDGKDFVWKNENIKSKIKFIKTHFLNNTHKIAEKKVIL